MSIADVPSDPTGQETLRGYMVSRGATLPLTFERSVYNTIASEWAFGLATVQALVDPSAGIVTTEPLPEPETVVVAPDPEVDAPETTQPEPVVVIEPDPEPVVTPEPDASTQPLPESRILVADQFAGSESLHQRVPDGSGPLGSKWTVETGVLSVAGAGTVVTNNTARAVIDALGADVEVESTLNLGADGTGLILRSSNRSNYLRFTLTRTIWLFQRTVAGVTTTVASGRSTYPLKANYSLKATLSGPSIVLSIDGVVVRTFTESFNQTATRHGLLCSNTGVRSWDSFIVRTLE
jgi:hypothetical protein